MPVPEMVKNGLNSLFVIWGMFGASFLPSAFLRCPSLSSCEVSGGRSDVRLCDGYVGLMPSPWLSPSTRPKVAYQTSPHQAQIGKTRIKTILDQFRNKHARDFKCVFADFQRLSTPSRATQSGTPTPT
jgi:hypothetical protein